MALVAEDGTGVAGANSYADLDQAEAYHDEHGTLHAWTTFQTQGATEGALIDATAMLDARYAWRGGVLEPTQGLGLPRAAFVDNDGREWTVERQMERAVMATSLLALRNLQEPVAGASNVQSESLPDYSVTYGQGGKVIVNPDVDYLLAGLYAGGGMGGYLRNAKVVRWS